MTESMSPAMTQPEALFVAVQRAYLALLKAGEAPSADKVNKWFTENGLPVRRRNDVAVALRQCRARTTEVFDAIDLPDEAVQFMSQCLASIRRAEEERALGRVAQMEAKAKERIEAATAAAMESQTQADTLRVQLAEAHQTRRILEANVEQGQVALADLRGRLSASEGEREQVSQELLALRKSFDALTQSKALEVAALNQRLHVQAADFRRQFDESSRQAMLRLDSARQEGARALEAASAAKAREAQVQHQLDTVTAELASTKASLLDVQTDRAVKIEALVHSAAELAAAKGFKEDAVRWRAVLPLFEKLPADNKESRSMTLWTLVLRGRDPSAGADAHLEQGDDPVKHEISQAIPILKRPSP